MYFSFKCHPILIFGCVIFTGERTHTCSTCHKKFTSIYNLRDHEKRHTKEFACFCPICPNNSMGFYKKVYMEKHMERAHGERPQAPRQRRAKQQPKRNIDVDNTPSTSNSSGSSNYSEEINQHQVIPPVPILHFQQQQQQQQQQHPNFRFVQQPMPPMAHSSQHLYDRCETLQLLFSVFTIWYRAV